MGTHAGNTPSMQVLISGFYFWFNYWSNYLLFIELIPNIILLVVAFFYFV